jgi:hypothetical protein
MRRAIEALAVAGLLAGLAVACASGPSTQFTSIREGDCADAPGDVQQRFEAESLGVQQCEGVPGWQVFVVSSDANTWIELRSMTTAWSAEDAIVYQQPVGLFPGIDASAPLEWHVDSRRGPTAVLFTVTAQSPEDAETKTSRVFVVRFDENGRTCVAGRERTAEDARNLAAMATPCPSA